MMKLALFLLVALLPSVAPYGLISRRRSSSTAAKAGTLPVDKAVKTRSKSVDITESVKKAVNTRKKWGIDNEHPEEYWFDDRIHTLGNAGFWGAVHAALAPISTSLIDRAAYKGVDVRSKLAKELSSRIGKQKARIVDLCCGVGFSTRALQNAFPNSEIMGIDTSKEMIAMAEFITSHINNFPITRISSHHLQDSCSASYKAMKKKGYAMKQKAIQYLSCNAEATLLPDRSVDLVTVMYAFHEAPKKGREAILQEARRLLSPGGTLAVVDISTDYVPSKTMLSGEPYVQEYQQNIHKQLARRSGFDSCKYETVVDGHLGMWTLKRSAMA